MATGFVRRSKAADRRTGARRSVTGEGTYQDRNLVPIGKGSYTDHEQFAPKESEPVKMHHKMAGQP
jgi:hypothetical protein